MGEKESPLADLGEVKTTPIKTIPARWLELDKTLPEVVSAPMNSDLTLECVAVGSPPPRVYWLKDGKPMDHVSESVDGHTLCLLRSLNASQADLHVGIARYFLSCQIAQFHFISLVLQMMPYGLDFSNQVYGWGSPVKRDEGGDFSMANVKSKLPLRCLRPEDQGEYSCVAENEGRQLIATTTLAVEGTTKRHSFYGHN